MKSYYKVTQYTKGWLARWFKFSFMPNLKNKKRMILDSKGSVLIVEDERLTAEYLKIIVENAGYSVVHICSRGSEAIKSALKYKPDLIFMDIMLKDNISGSEAALKITNMIDTKIIFTTAYNDDEMVEYAIDSNASSYILKPYSEEQIITSLKLALGKSLLIHKRKIILELNYWYDLENKILYRNDIEIALKEQYLQVIDLLCRNLNKALSYEYIINNIYKKQTKAATLRTLISRINKDIGYNIIQNVSGVGYKITGIIK